MWREPILRALIAAAGTMNFFGRMFLAVYVLFMTRDLGLGPVGVGLVLATGGIGSLAGALVTGPTTRRFGPGPMLVASQLAFGLMGLLVPLAILFPRVALVMIVASEFGQWMAVIVYYVNAVSVRQTITPSRLQGRVNATMRFFAGGLMPIGALAGGALGGVIAVGGPFFYTSTRTFQGKAYHEAVEADIVTNDGTACFFRNNPRVAEEVFAHLDELGRGSILEGIYAGLRRARPAWRVFG